MSRTLSRVDSLDALLHSNKLARLIETKFNEDKNAIDQAMTAAIERVKVSCAELNGVVNGGVVAQLSAFRKEVGEEMWTTIANNPSLSDLLRNWVEEKRSSIAGVVVDEFKKMLPDNHDMSDSQILVGIQALIG